MRGQGRTFQRGSVWWIAYFRLGKEYRESSKSKNKKDAERLLKRKLIEVGADAEGFKPFVAPNQNKVLVGSLLDHLLQDYKFRGKASLGFLSHLKQVRAMFGDLRVIDCNEALMDNTIDYWLGKGRAAGTINREMQILGQAFKLGVEHKRLSSAPKVRRLPDNARRQGFFEREQFEAVVKYLPANLKDFTLFAYFTGWRKGEISSLEWNDIDLHGRIICLRGENSKNGEGRRVAIEGEIEKILDRRLEQKDVITEQGVRSQALVFHRNGLPVQYFRKSWAMACRKAKTPGKLFHDLRRTAIRNMVRSGTPESVCMKISGHKTRSVFLRYDITSERDIRDAQKRLDGYISSLPSGEHGQNTDSLM